MNGVPTGYKWGSKPKLPHLQGHFVGVVSSCITGRGPSCLDEQGNNDAFGKMVGLQYVTVALKVLVEFKQKDGVELHSKAFSEETCHWEIEASFMIGIRSKPTRVSVFDEQSLVLKRIQHQTLSIPLPMW